MVELERLIEFAKAGDRGSVQQMLAQAPELAVARLPSGESALMAALYRGQREVAEELIRAGAARDVFAAAATGLLPELEAAISVPGALNSFAYDGWTPLHLAAFFGQAAAVNVLLRAGADVTAVSQNSLTNTPLHAAAAGRHSDAALLLLQGGANPHALDAGGYTALDIARENGLMDVVEAAAQKGS